MMEEKQCIRRKVWEMMERNELVPFPLPLHGRIPNFIGNKQAARNLCGLQEFRKAKVVKIHPSLNATWLRSLTLKFKKTVLVPPLPGNEFLYFSLDPHEIPNDVSLKFISSKRGFNKYGRKLKLEEIPQIDLVVVASVACTKLGGRLGKGKGYGEVEYGILRELGSVCGSTPVATIIHDTQLLDETELPTLLLQEHDLPVDIIATPTQIIRTETAITKPRGIIWGLITDQMREDIGSLKHLQQLKSDG